MERMVEKGKNGYYIPSDRGTFGVEVDQYGEIEKTRFTGTVVDRLGEYEQSGYGPGDFDKLCREMSRLRLKARCKTYEEFKKKLDYPEYVLRYLRQRWGMKPDDTRRDEIFQGMDPKRVFSEVLIWNGLLSGWDRQIIGWIKDIFGVDLEDNR